ncbi:TPA: hypothetical protein ACGT9I_001320 [Salmonella enterica]|jgi:hypothetical protein|nr:hypothetical protein [Salmonella enterica subsp. enterica serovar Enteritidis]EHJ3658796.1 hypothetical protein [Salmonella enterica]HAU7316526.1 hypothetical protein [Salmonella enterica subsp. enterica serovar Wangata]HDN4850021.1 hypothetical protein [Salmonella enterica subsp. enterica serovar Bovismorbificans]HDO5800036.1 hypothetical protein [Salmonella enterica subsp. enterica serovar Typhimurium]HEC7107635.1 hypothetical protein [Salmonella enterica subsp. enterica serovar Mississip
MNVILWMWIFAPWFFASICVGIACGLAKLVRMYLAMVVPHQSNSR